ncbi:MAG TPA: hypothetical protein VEX18_12030, partial [Polyangiaceae bacterium]|nr:hypothetical protein [Polyangiaceae bacterium]
GISCVARSVLRKISTRKAFVSANDNNRNMRVPFWDAPMLRVLYTRETLRPIDRSVAKRTAAEPAT